MSVLTVLDVRDMLGVMFSEDNNLIMSNSINRNNEKSIGVFLAPESRLGKVETFGGDDLAPVTPLPVNILVRWTEDSNECERKARQIYSALKKSEPNSYSRLRDPSSAKIAFIRMLDAHPVWLGREKDNVCEFSIRTDIFYYH